MFHQKKLNIKHAQHFHTVGTTNIYVQMKMTYLSYSFSICLKTDLCFYNTVYRKSIIKAIIIHKYIIQLQYTDSCVNI